MTENKRVIKFRAWTGAEMVHDGDETGLHGARVMHDSVWYYDESNDVFYWRENDYGHREVIFMQFTGLTDKNGVERCDGDIIKRYTGYTFVEEKKWFSLGGANSAKAYGYDYHPDDEVIGNIYQNPDLITSKQ